MNHPASQSILDLRLGEFIQRLGSADPTPGGGAAAAMVGALGAALVQMTANLTIGKPRWADVQTQAHSIEQRASRLREQLQGLGDADSEAFEHVGAAYRLPRGDEAEKAKRASAIQTALRGAADIPLETARVAAHVLELAEEAAPVLNAAVISDVLVGALLAQTALKSAALNVEINLAAMTDASSKEHYATELERAREGMDARVERILAAGRSRFGN